MLPYRPISLTHSNLIKEMKSLDYPSDDGICHGFSCMANFSILSGEKEKILQRTKFICQTADLKDKVKSALGKKNKNLTQEDNKFIDVFSYFGGIEIAQRIQEYKYFLGQQLFQLNIIALSKIIASEKINARGGIVNLYSSARIATEYELEQDLKTLGALLSELNNEQKNLPLHKRRELVIFVRNRGQHAICLIYHPDSSYWEIIDTNQLSEQVYFYHAKTISKALHMAIFSPDKYTRIHFSVYTTKDYPNLALVKERFSMLQFSFSVTDEMLERKINQTDAVLDLALQCDQPEIFQEIITKKSIWEAHKNTIISRCILINSLDSLEMMFRAGINVNDSIFGKRLICHAAENDSVDVIHLLNRFKVDFSWENKAYEDTPLMTAVEHKNIAAVRALLTPEYKVDINAINAIGKTAAYLAAASDSIHILHELLEHKADSNCGENDFPLLVAATKGYLNIIRLLAKPEYKTDLNRKSKTTGGTALISAASNGHAATVNFLLNAKADVSLQQNDRMTPFLSAISRGHSEVTKIFLSPEYKFDIQQKAEMRAAVHLAVKNNYPALLSILTDHKCDLLSEVVPGLTLACFAAKSGSVDCLRMLATFGIDLEKPSSTGYTPLLAAIDAGKEDIVNFLMQQGFKSNLNDYFHGETPVYRASRMNLRSIVKILVAHGADLEKHGPEGSTIDEAIKNRRSLILTEFKLAFLKTDMLGATRIHRVAANGQTDELSALLDSELDLFYIGDLNGDTAAHHAARRNQAATLQLLDRIFPLNDVQNNQDQTPTHICAQQGFLDGLKTLIELGVDLEKKDNAGKTALNLASQSKHQAVKQYIDSLYFTIPSDEKTEKHFLGNYLPLSFLGSDEHKDYYVRDIHQSNSIKQKWRLLSQQNVSFVLSCLINKLDSKMLIRFFEFCQTYLTDYLNPEILANTYNIISNRSHKLAFTNFVIKSLDYASKKALLLQIPSSDWKEINACCDTPLLHTAVRNNDAKMVKSLIEAGRIDPTAIDRQGRNAVHEAASANAAEALQTLLEYKVSLSHEDNLKWTAPTIAASKDHLSILKILAAHGCDLYQSTSDNFTPLRLAVTIAYHFELIQFLLEQKAPEHRAAEATKVLPFAARVNLSATVELLLKHGGNPNAPGPSGTAVEVAIKEKSYDVINTLKEVIETPDTGAEGGWTPALLAAANGNEDIITTLGSSQVNFNKPNRAGYLAVHNAAHHGHDRVLNRLVEYKASLNLADNEGMTAAHFAANNQKLEIIKLLKKHEAKLGEKNSAGQTPLHLAAKKGFLEICKQLLAYEVSLSVKDNSGKTAWDLAKEYKHSAVEDYFASLYIDIKHNASVQTYYIGDYIPHCFLYKSKKAIPRAIMTNWDRLHPQLFSQLLAYVINQVPTENLIEFLKEMNLESRPGKDLGAIYSKISSNAHKKIFIQAINTIDYNNRIELMNAVPPLEGKNIYSNFSPSIAKQAIELKEYRTLSNLLAVLKINPNEVCAETKKPLLHFAIESNAVEAVDLLIEHKAFLDCESPSNWNPALIAARDNNLTILRTLAKHGVDLKAPASDGYTPLMTATKEGHLEIVRFLLLYQNKYSLNLRIPNSGATAIYLALINNKIDIFKLLYQAGADVTLRGTSGSPIDIALENKLDPIICLLKSEIETPDDGPQGGWTPALRAALEGNILLIQTLIHNNFNFSKPNREGWLSSHNAAAGGYAAILKLLAEKMDLRTPNSYGQTPAHLAAKHNRLDAIKVLAQHNAITHSPDKEGKTPLQWSLASGQLEIAECIIEAEKKSEEKDKNIIAIYRSLADERKKRQWLEKTISQLSYAHQKSLYKEIPIAEWKKIDALQKESILQLAAINNDVEFVECLLAKGNFDVNKKNPDGRYAIHSAVLGNAAAVIRKLVEFKANLSCRMKGFFTPAVYAIIFNRFLALEALIEMGVSPNNLDKHGFTLLMQAALYNKIRAMEVLLVQFKADPNAAGSCPDYNALFYAVQNKSLEAVNLLLEHKADPRLGGGKMHALIHRYHEIGNRLDLSLQRFSLFGSISNCSNNASNTSTKPKEEKGRDFFLM